MLIVCFDVVCGTWKIGSEANGAYFTVGCFIQVFYIFLVLSVLLFINTIHASKWLRGVCSFFMLIGQ